MPPGGTPKYPFNLGWHAPLPERQSVISDERAVPTANKADGQRSHLRQRVRLAKTRACRRKSLNALIQVPRGDFL
ncbi:MAG: hypothetical protein M2R46_04870 [Verrucomicrobia subdivision 3 bacterium]|nr:hypothetical protein [Limisphaerales bacterium]